MRFLPPTVRFLPALRAAAAAFPLTPLTPDRAPLPGALLRRPATLRAVMEDVRVPPPGNTPGLYLLMEPEEQQVLHKTPRVHLGPLPLSAAQPPLHAGFLPMHGPARDAGLRGVRVLNGALRGH